MNGLHPISGIGLSLSIMIVSTILLFHGVEIVGHFYFMLMWWPFIILLISWSHIRAVPLPWKNHREFFFLCLTSTFLWVFFEAYNLILNNWSYIHIQPEGWVRWISYTVAFATVLPGIFLCAQLCELFMTRRRQPQTFFRGWEVVFVIIGLICAVAPLLWPQSSFALVWVAFIFLTEPLNYHLRAPSLVRQHEQGDDRKLTSLLLSGLICGILWECWNWKATTKWIYSLPFLEDSKLFEMPCIGFLGFPPFAVECWVMYQTCQIIWKKTNSLGRFVLGASVTVFVLWTYQQMDLYTVI